MKGERMIILRGLLPVFVSFIIYKRGKRARAADIVKDLQCLLGRPIPKSLVFTTLKRLIRYGVVEKETDGNRTYYILNEDGEVFLIRHIEILKNINVVIQKVINQMENNG